MSLRAILCDNEKSDLEFRISDPNTSSSRHLKFASIPHNKISLPQGAWHQVDSMPGTFLLRKTPILGVNLARNATNRVPGTKLRAKFDRATGCLAPKLGREWGNACKLRVLGLLILKRRLPGLVAFLRGSALGLELEYGINSKQKIRDAR